jgi:nucleolin
MSKAKGTINKKNVDAALSSDEESSEVQVKKTVKTNGHAKPTKKVVVQEDSSDEDVNLLKSKKKAATAVVEKKVVKKSKVVVESDSSSEAVVVVKKTVKSPAKVVKKVVVESSDSSDEVPVKVVKKVVKSPAKVVKKVVVESDSDDEVPVKVVKKVVKSPAKVVKKVVDSDDSSDDVPVKKTVKSPAKALKKAVVESSDEEEIVIVKKTDPVVAEASAGEHNELFVKNLSWNTDENVLATFFGTYGTITKTKVLYTPEGKSKGIGFVEFSSNAECKAALDDVANLFCDGRALQVNYSGQKPPAQGGTYGATGGSSSYGGPPASFVQNHGGEKHTAFVGNLPFKANENTLANLFKACGGIVEVRLAKDRDTGKLKGFGHIDFADADSLKKCMEMNGCELDGRQLKVDASTPKAGGSFGGDRGGRGGGRGGFGGGRGGGRGGFGDPMARAQKSGAMLQSSGNNVINLED